MSEGLEKILQSTDKEDAFYRIIRDYFSTNEGIEQKSRYSKDMVINITALEVMNAVIEDEFGFKSKVIDKIVERYRVNVINQEGKARQEIIEALKAANPETEQTNKQASLMRRIFGV